MFLIIVKTEEEIAKKLWKMLDGLELTPGVYLTWAPREKIVKSVDAIKKDVIKRWEEEGKGPLFEAAVLELTEEQYKEVRPLARGVVEKIATAMLEEMERLLEKMRSGKDRSLSGWYRDLAKRYERLINITLALDIEPTVMGKLKDKWREVTLEAGRRLRKS
ncbi:conserved hypothetical protein [Pyrobaculum islandicum DSM 4184]|uniref:Uncharacterized protein n=1 Tax=Pyrobaculum islandicum (strain DSM 4184 / JCM 9189 / GEO3) TaxID=384616 RepID=A1RW17_PYRIL|nr:hypothetical protein [Pyrobaculum islandicum]ABL89149.1 conserved hypothetical protein [Pyrobaculum islandicum DSM 4184]